MARTSWGFSWSAPMTVMTTWVSLRKPSAKLGRSGPVGEATGQDGVLGGPPLPAEERAGDLARCVGPLLDVDGEGEEVDAGTDVVGGVGRRQHGGLTDRGDDGALALRGEPARLEGQRTVGPGHGAPYADGVGH